MPFYVYHRTLEKNAKQILTHGLKPCFRNNGEGYTKNTSIPKCDKSLDDLIEEKSLNKPKRLESNFAWLSLSHAKNENLHSNRKEVILKLEVDPLKVFVGNRFLWNVAYSSFRSSEYLYKPSTFEELSIVYWLNVISLNNFLHNKYEIKFTDNFDQDLKYDLIHKCKNRIHLEVIIPHIVEPSEISLCSQL